MYILEAIIVNNPKELLTKYATALVDELSIHNKQLAVAESCTGGLVAKAITDVSGASNVFHCGVISYVNEIKTEVLGVDKDFLSENGPVNIETAIMMAEGVRKLGHADIGIGISGVAGPGPDGGHPEGEVHIALSDGTDNMCVSLDTKTVNKREYNRELATLNAINLVLFYLKKNKEEG